MDPTAWDIVESEGVFLNWAEQIITDQILDNMLKKDQLMNLVQLSLYANLSNIIGSIMQLVFCYEQEGIEPKVCLMRTIGLAWYELKVRCEELEILDIDYIPNVTREYLPSLEQEFIETQSIRATKQDDNQE